jgi:hypothetical protein
MRISDYEQHFFTFNTDKIMNPQATAVIRQPSTTTVGDMPFPITLIPAQKKVAMPKIDPR